MTGVQAAEQTRSITDFDRLQVIGSMDVIISPSRITGAQIVGTVSDIERVQADVHDGLLSVQLNSASVEDNNHTLGKIIIYITSPHLNKATLIGSGRLKIMPFHEAKIIVNLAGSGEVEAVSLHTDNLVLTSSGSGRMTISGKSEQTSIEAVGSGDVVTHDLLTKDLKVSAQGSASVSAFASRSALLDADGATTISITGQPACTVHNSGAATITCH